MDARIFFDFSQRTGMFRCRSTGNRCGTDTVGLGGECPMGRDQPCLHRVAFEAGYEAAYAVNCAPRVDVVMTCGYCGEPMGDKCPLPNCMWGSEPQREGDGQ